MDDDRDLLARLRAVDPAGDLEPASPETVSRMLEDVMKQPTDVAEKTADTRTADPKTAANKGAAATKGSGADDATPKAPETKPGATPLWRRVRWAPVLAGAAAAAMVVIAGIGVMNQRTTTTEQPPAAAPEVTSTSIGAPAQVPARCVPPSPEVLAGVQLAVDATVTDVSGTEVTLTVNEWFAGTPTDEVVLTAPAPSLAELVGAPDLQVGQRYLLAANDGQLVVCGFSGPFDSDRSTLYTAAFGG